MTSLRPDVPSCTCQGYTPRATYSVQDIGVQIFMGENPTADPACPVHGLAARPDVRRRMVARDG